MKEFLVRIRNGLFALGYKWILKPIFFRIDPEIVHDCMLKFGRLLGSNVVTRFGTRIAFGYSHPMLEQTVAGIKFMNPVGLAAGFDKNAELTRIIPEVGFGFEEVGSVTGERCTGNAKPRLWRHTEERSLRVNYGLMNDGAEAISQKMSGKKFRIPIGISIAKTNDATTVETEQGIADYVKAYRAFEQIGDYITINISCPNAFGGQPFTDVNKLDALLNAIARLPKNKPVFLKLSPDLEPQQLDEIASIADKYEIDGFVCSNLTKKHSFGNGGLGGKLQQPRSDEQIKFLYKRYGGRKIIIGCGGIFTAEDAYLKIKAGATLVQMVTGMIYEGPQTISEINRCLVAFLKKDGHSNIKSAIGTGV
ncbi:MAG: quinone-dependent dihydroorotate dehydrogenase [Patescibacteria group bacterium]|nr:quinone-dependent dihydroorotate dehydrogenase [Patescibacteria group bacterium]